MAYLFCHSLDALPTKLLSQGYAAGIHQPSGEGRSRINPTRKSSDILYLSQAINQKTQLAHGHDSQKEVADPAGPSLKQMLGIPSRGTGLVFPTQRELNVPTPETTPIFSSVVIWTVAALASAKDSSHDPVKHGQPGACGLEGLWKSRWIPGQRRVMVESAIVNRRGGVWRIHVGESKHGERRRNGVHTRCYFCIRLA